MGSSPFHFSLKYLYKYFDLFWLEYLALVVRPWETVLGIKWKLIWMRI